MNTTTFENLDNLIFLKLGGSLITDKHQPRTPRQDVLDRLADEIGAVWREQNGLRLVLGHGSGSFGHVPARKYGTRQTVQSREEWIGFAEVWYEAQLLNRLVMDALVRAGLPAIAISPVSSAIAHDGRVQDWNLDPVQQSLQAGLLPVLYGDVAFDTFRGGTILSTEDLFGHLAVMLRPKRILLAGIEAGVWEDFPACTRLVPEIRPENYGEVSVLLSGSTATDVTGGMASKVQSSLELVGRVPGLQVIIFSGEAPGSLTSVLAGSTDGTLIHAD